MAQITTVKALDDLEHKAGREVEAEHPDTAFMLDGRGYTIDLSAHNYQQLMGILEPFIKAGRKVTGAGGVVRRRSPSTAERERNNAIRDWAATRGLKVAERGRIPAEILDAYHEDQQRKGQSNGQSNGQAPAGGGAAAARRAIGPNSTWTPPTPAEKPVEKPKPEPQRFATQRDANQAIRDFVRGQGITVSTRGAIPKEFRQMYAEAHGGDPIVDE